MPATGWPNIFSATPALGLVFSQQDHSWLRQAEQAAAADGEGNDDAVADPEPVAVGAVQGAPGDPLLGDVLGRLGVPLDSGVSRSPSGSFGSGLRAADGGDDD